MLTVAARTQAAARTRRAVREAVNKARLDRAVGPSVATEGNTTNAPSRNSGRSGVKEGEG
jgi:hypothetical protein